MRYEIKREEMKDLGFGSKTKAENQKYVRRGQNKAFEAIKSIQQEDS